MEGVMGRSAESAFERLLAGSPLRRRRVAIPVIVALAAAILFSTAAILLAVGSLKATAAWLFAIGLLFSAGLSIIPVLILRYLDRREREAPWLFAVSILWGALIATGLALPVNTGIIMAIGQWLQHHPNISEYPRPTRYAFARCAPGGAHGGRVDESAWRRSPLCISAR